MKYALLILVCLSSCTSAIKYPAGGYNYPTNISKSDSDFYFYPLKDIISKKDSFRDGLAYKFFNVFNESNISLKPLDKETFRFVYDGWHQYPLIILLSDRKIIVKPGKQGLH